MSSLTAEQLKQIQKNREMALLKRKAAEAVKHSTSANLLTFTDKAAPKILKPVHDSGYSRVQCSSIPAVCRLLPGNKFTVDMPFHSPTIELFKTIPGKLYDPASRAWKFPLSSYEILINKLKEPVVVNGIPQTVLNAFKTSEVALETKEIDLSKIDSTLLNSILPFQEEGIRFGISKNGRCLIADDMGLGKTIQALGIAHYYYENWPLLIICPSTMRFPWEEAIQNFLPSVNPFYINVMTNRNDVINEANVVICSYDLMKNCVPELLKKNFGVIIIDESHCLKSQKTARTKSTLQISSKCKRVVLLSGTPALSRPEELYTQIIAIDPFSFRSYIEFGLRYCNGKKDKYGWNFSGSSNMEELELFLKKKIMIRRLKSDVITQLPSKLRKVVILNPDMVKAVTKQMKKFANDFENQKGMEKRSTLLSYYSLTGNAKIDAVCDYLKEKLDCNHKFLVFAHHNSVITAICDMIASKNIDCIKIDGATNPEMRKIFCDKFQNDPDCRVAVLSIKAANSGITLTAAHLVVFAELYWNPGELTQAEDRAHRIGQHDSVIVEYLVAKGTADEHIWNLVQSKLNVLNKAGLSKDNFKEADTEQLVDKKQLTIDSMLLPAKSDDIKFDEFSECLFGGIDDDDIFASIELEEIENKYNLEIKKRRTEF